MKDQIPRNKYRIRIVQGVCLVLLGTFLWRVYDVQSVYGAKLIHNESKSVDSTSVSLAQRGTIEDEQGQALAYDIPAYYLDLHVPDMQKYADAVSSDVAPILGTTQSQILSILNGNDTWYQWKSVVNQNVKSNLQTLFNKHPWDTSADKIDWNFDITFTPTEKRIYPYGDYAANTLGYIATNGKAVGGIEQEFNQYLNGTNGIVTSEQDVDGYTIPGTQKVIKPAKSGDTVQLTLNGDIQGYVEFQMNDLIKKFKPKHAAIIVTNPQTGKILAISSRPTFDPNQYWTASSEALSTNWAVSSSFEPGSTFKPFVLATALATHSINLYTKYMSGHINVDGYTINDWNYGNGWGKITYQEALEKSSNVGFTKIALATGWPNLDKYIDLFGFNHRTGVDLPDEAHSILFPKSDQNKIQLATTGFGQGISITPMQQVEAMGAIANGGKLIQPQIVNQIMSPTGKVIKSYKPDIVRQNFISSSALNTVKNTMVLDVSGKQGIDQSAEIPGYQVAGKTGTAQVVDPKTGKYYNNQFITSFMGFAPASHPIIEVYVTVDDPNTPEYETWGSTVSAPFAKNIMEYVLKKDQIPPDNPNNISSTQMVKAPTTKVNYLTTPNVVGTSSNQANVVLSKDGFRVVLIGKSGSVEHQEPPAGTRLEKGQSVYLVTDGFYMNGEITVPNLMNMSMKNAMDLLSLISLNGVPKGVGYVTSQSPVSGTKVKLNSNVTFSLKQ